MSLTRYFESQNLQNKNYSSNFFLLLLEAWGQWKRIYADSPKMKKILKKVKGLYVEDKTDFYDFLGFSKREMLKQEKERIFQSAHGSHEIRERRGFEFNSVSKTGNGNSLEIQRTVSELELSDEHAKSFEMERLSNVDEFRVLCKEWGSAVNVIQVRLKFVDVLEDVMKEVIEQDIANILRLGMQIDDSLKKIESASTEPVSADMRAVIAHYTRLRNLSHGVCRELEELYEGNLRYDQVKRSILDVDTNMFIKMNAGGRPGSRREEAFGQGAHKGDAEQANSDEMRRKILHLDTIVEESVEFDSKRQSKISTKLRTDAISEYNMASHNNLSTAERKLGFDDFQSFNENVSVGGSYTSGVFADGKSLPFNSDIEIRRAETRAGNQPAKSGLARGGELPAQMDPSAFFKQKKKSRPSLDEENKFPSEVMLKVNTDVFQDSSNGFSDPKIRRIKTELGTPIEKGQFEMFDFFENGSKKEDTPEKQRELNVNTSAKVTSIQKTEKSKEISPMGEFDFDFGKSPQNDSKSPSRSHKKRELRLEKVKRSEGEEEFSDKGLYTNTEDGNEEFFNNFETNTRMSEEIRRTNEQFSNFKESIKQSQPSQPFTLPTFDDPFTTGDTGPENQVKADNFRTKKRELPSTYNIDSFGQNLVEESDKEGPVESQPRNSPEEPQSRRADTRLNQELQIKTTELESVMKNNKKLSKENSLFKQEFRQLMDTIKSLQSQVFDLRSQVKEPTGPLKLGRVELGRLQRKYEFLEQENRRLREMQGDLKQESQRSFGRMIEMNKYYRMLNQTLGEYVTELKTGLGRANGRNRAAEEQPTGRDSRAHPGGKEEHVPGHQLDPKEVPRSGRFQESAQSRAARVELGNALENVHRRPHGRHHGKGPAHRQAVVHQLARFGSRDRQAARRPADRGGQGGDPHGRRLRRDLRGQARRRQPGPAPQFGGSEEAQHLEKNEEKLRVGESGGARTPKRKPAPKRIP